MRFHKHILSAGTYNVQGKPYPITRSDLERFAKVGNEMLKARLAIPVPAEHQNVEPMDAASAAAAFALHNSGWVKDFEMTPDGRLYATLEIEDEDVAKKLPKTIRYVSPEIRANFTDGNGRNWGKCITHIALTPQPIFSEQEPFGPAWMSMKGIVRLSMGDLKGGNSMASTYVDDVDDVDDDVDEGDEGSGMAVKLKRLSACLAELGIVVEPSRDLEEFIDHMCTAVETHKATKRGGADEGDEFERRPDLAQPAGGDGGAHVVAMSSRLADGEPLTDGEAAVAHYYSHGRWPTEGAGARFSHAHGRTAPRSAEDADIDRLVARMRGRR